jgi:hypothetical protein
MSCQLILHTTGINQIFYILFLPDLTRPKDPRTFSTFIVLISCTYISLKPIDMINPQSVVRLLENYVLKVSRSAARSSDHTARDEEVAKQLYENLLSILNSTEYRFETQDTLDYSFDIDQLVENAQDTDYKEEDDGEN